jgi:probable HAF family extracellular repeat protein
MPRVIHIAILPSFMAAPIANAMATDPFFMGIGDLPGGSPFSVAYGVSGDGSVACGKGHGPRTMWPDGFAVRWTLRDGLTSLGDLAGGPIDSTAFDVSADGLTIVGWSDIASGTVATRWTDPSAGGIGLQNIGDLPGGTVSAFAYACSADGSVVVGESSSAASAFNVAFRWVSPGPMVSLGDLPGGVTRSVASGISADGSIVCGDVYTAAGVAAALWTQAGGWQPIGMLPEGTSSNARDISADGHIVVGWGNTVGHVTNAFRWTDPAEGGEGMISLGVLPGATHSFAHDVSDEGDRVVGSSNISNDLDNGVAFVWFERKGMVDLKEHLEDDLALDLSGWTLVSASAISGDGLTIVGYGDNPMGQTEGWIAHLGSPNKSVPGDLDGDGIVGSADLAELLAQWGPCVDCAADITGDGVVGPADLAQLLAAWST